MDGMMNGKTSSPDGRVHEPLPHARASAAVETASESGLNKLNLSMKAISECNNALIHAADEADLLYQICRIITDTCGYKLAWVGYALHDHVKSVQPIAQVGFDDGYLDQAGITWDDTERGRGPIGTAIRTSKPFLTGDILTDPNFTPWRAEALKRGYAACIALPLLIDGQVIGALNIYSTHSVNLGSDEMVLLSELAKFLSFGIAAIRGRVQQAESEQALRLSEERLRILGDNLPDSYVYQYDYRPDGSPRFLYISAGVKALHGVSADDILHDANLLFCQMKPEQIPAFLSAEEHSMKTLTDVEIDMEMQHTDGQWRWFRLRSRPRHDEHGHVVWDGVATDVTERKCDDAARRALEHKYRELVDNANSIILRWTPDGTITYLNEYGQRFFGYAESDIIGNDMFSTIGSATGRYAENLRHMMELNPNEFEQSVNEHTLKSGERAWIAWTNKVVVDQAGQIREIMSIGLDITEQKRMEENLRIIQANLENSVMERTAQLAEALNDAQAADRIKSAFLATMSHELRTPLNSIIGFTGLLLQGLAGPLNTEQTKQLTMVKSSGQHLLDLINDVLDISKIEAGQVELATAPFDLHACIDQVVKTVTPQAVHKTLPIYTEIEDDIGFINGDKRRFEQVMLNLLSNAIKFTEQGHITVSARKVGSMYHIAVADTGVGIKPEDMDKLFIPFRQLDSGLSRQFEGTGLGLAICKRLVEKMDGEITVRTTPGSGSTFEIKLKDTLGGIQ